MSSRLLEGILEYYEEEEILMANGFDEAVIGIDDKTMRLIYSVTQCIEILMVEMEMDIEEECLKVLALHQQVAIDLRYIIADP